MVRLKTPWTAPDYVRGTSPVELLSNAYTTLQDGLGNFVLVSSPTGGGNGFQTRYGHLSQVFVKPNDSVKKGDLLGLSGHTGNSSAPHVHVEFKPWISVNNPGPAADFKLRLPTEPDGEGYNDETFVKTDRPLAHSTSGALVLYNQPDTGSDQIATLAVPAATWTPSQGGLNPLELTVGAIDSENGRVTATTNIGDATNSVDFAGIFTLSLDGNTVSLAVTATVPATEPATEHDTGAAIADNYFQVSSVYLPPNLRPPVVTVASSFAGYANARLYVLQDGRIYYRNYGMGSDSLATCTLTWPLAYSVIGKDHPTTASWWQIVVPGLDQDAEEKAVAGMIGWVPGSAVTVTDDHRDRVQVTWPPPPYQLNASGTYSATVAGQVRVDLAWQKPQDLWTGAEVSPGSGYRILRGSSPKTLDGHGTTAALSWAEHIPPNSAFYYAVAGVAGDEWSVRSRVAKVVTGVVPPPPPTSILPAVPPVPIPMLTVRSAIGVNVRSSPMVTDTNKIGELAEGATAEIFARSTLEGPDGTLTGGLWWQIDLPGHAEAWVANGPAGDGAYVEVSNADDVPGFPAPLGGGGLAPIDPVQVPPSGGALYARQGLAAGSDPLRRWPAADAPALATGVQAAVWYTVRRLFARTGLGDLWLEVQPHSAIPSGTASGAAGWVPAARMVLAAQGTPMLPPSARFVRLRAWVTAGANVRSGPDTAYTPVLRTLTDRSAWYRLEAQNATPATWYRLEYTAGSYGWVYAGLLDLIEPVRIPLAALPLQQASSTPPAESGPTGTAATGTTATAGHAQGDFRNLVTNPDGRWSVTKTGRTASLSFDCPRSPVQYYARQNPQPQFVLPAAFRPTRTVTQTVTGTEVDANRLDLPGSPSVTFTVRIETDGEVRYVNNSQVDHVGFVRYGVRALELRTATALVEPVDPTPPGDLSASGTYHNRQDNWGSRWALAREGDAVSGTFTTTRSAAEYYANDENPEALLWLPGEYWPDQDARFRVTGAVRVNKDGTDSPDTRLVNFWITVQRSDGRMYYDPDTALEAAGVGYVRYTVDVDWTAVARLTVPAAPRELEVDDIAATEVELDWRSPAYDGGASIDEYRVEEYRNGRWRTAEDDISGSRTTVEDRDPYTRYSFRVRAHNRVGWSEPTTAVTVTTLRAAPGTPGRPTATATQAQVALSWTAPTTGGTVTGYRIQRRVGSGSWQTRVADTGETSPGWTDAAARAGHGLRVPGGGLQLRRAG